MIKPENLLTLNYNLNFSLKYLRMLQNLDRMLIRGNNKGINQHLFMVFSPVSGFVYCFQRVTCKQASNPETGKQPAVTKN